MKHIILAAITMAAICSCNNTKESTNGREATTSSSKWISKIIDYRPAAGQFINSSLGNKEAAQSIVGKQGTVSLGGFGGYIIFTFDHTVRNIAGTDFVIHGNAFQGGSEPGAVEVSFDENANGIADDPWYAISTPAHGQAKMRAITYTRPDQTASAADVKWTLSDGSEGEISSELTKEFHSQCYYPLFIEGNLAVLSFTGKMLPPNAKLDTQTGFWSLETIEGGGYVDNFSPDYMQVIGNDRDTERSNKFDIDLAIDSKGAKVELSGIDFIKVYTCINAQAGTIGECSTEVCGAISLSTSAK